MALPGAEAELREMSGLEDPMNFFEIDGRVLGDMQFGVLLGVLFEVLVTVWVPRLMGKVLGACSLGCWCRCALGCCLLVTLRAHFCEIGGRAVWDAVRSVGC